MRRAILGIFLALAQGPKPQIIDPPTSLEKKASRSPAYVIAGPDGIFYTKCVPSDETRENTIQGTTRIYRVRSDADELLDSYDFYAPRAGQPGVVLSWSPIAGKIAVLRTHDEPVALTDERVELTFYIGGKLLKSYTAKELLALGAKPRPSLHPESRPSLDYVVLGSAQVPNTNDYHFLLLLPGDKTVRFDILTGAVAR